MPSTETTPGHRQRNHSPDSGPRSRELLTRLSHRALAATETTRTNQSRTATTEPLRIADLFAGIGGFHLAFRQVGARCVFACENNPTARRIYEANHRTDTPELFEQGNFAGDITAITPADVPDHDVLTAGFPCQPFSLAGERRGFDDQRGQHFFEVARIIKAKRPAAFFLENVKGLVRHDGGRTFSIIRSVLTEDLGYSLHTQVVRACDFGLPQLRPRLFMVGFRRRTTPFRFPEPIPLTTKLGDILGGTTERDVSRTLMGSGHDKAYGQKFNWVHYRVNGTIHRLTPREALALQGFPPEFQLPDSYNAAMRLIGNSVAVPAVAATAWEIAHSLGFTPLPHQSTDTSEACS